MSETELNFVAVIVPIATFVTGLIIGSFGTMITVLCVMYKAGLLHIFENRLFGRNEGYFLQESNVTNGCTNYLMSSKASYRQNHVPINNSKHYNGIV